MGLGIGDRIGKWQIVGSAGCGGIAEVYRACEVHSGAEVAIKLLKAEFAADKEERRRLAREARTESSLRHPSILACYESGEWNGRPYLVTEYVDGESLRSRLDRERLSLTECVDIALAALQGLGAAHNAGVIHRDLKPGNIMLDRNGGVRLLDFGLARRCGSETLSGTRPGTVLGSVHYISPEQARGLAVDARTDLWSFGVILHEMVTGRLPFSGSTTAEILIAIVEREPVPARGPFEAILRRALTKARDLRYQSAAEFLDDLGRMRSRKWGGRLRHWLGAISASVR